VIITSAPRCPWFYNIGFTLLRASINNNSKSETVLLLVHF
jgi:hypothetical protein